MRFSRVEVVGAPSEIGDEVDQFGIGLQADDLARPVGARAARPALGRGLRRRCTPIDSASSSGRLVYLATRVTGRSLVPVALTSMLVWVAVNAAPQSPRSATPAASSISGRK